MKSSMYRKDKGIFCFLVSLMTYFFDKWMVEIALDEPFGEEPQVEVNILSVEKISSLANLAVAYEEESKW